MFVFLNYGERSNVSTISRLLYTIIVARWLADTQF